jgi:HEAT repeat protein
MALPDAIIEELIALTHDPDPKVRVAAVHDLCPCELKGDYPQAWDRIIEMVEDDDARVRSTVFHTLGDGSPRHREQDVVGAIRKLEHDKDKKLRRRVRNLMAHYARTGKINVL